MTITAFHSWYLLGLTGSRLVRFEFRVWLNDAARKAT